MPANDQAVETPGGQVMPDQAAEVADTDVITDDQLDSVAGAGWFDIRPLEYGLGRGG